jgi:hypothetical protein
MKETQMRIRTIKTMVNKTLDTICETDITTVLNFGNAYAFGEVSSLCNTDGDPYSRWERIIRIASTALAISSLNGRFVGSH